MSARFCLQLQLHPLEGRMGISAPAFLALGAWFALAVPVFAQAADDPTRDPAVRAVRDAFRIEGLGLFDARPVRGPGCADSAVAGMTWCGGGTNYVTAENGTYTRSLGYNVDAAGRVVYIILTRREFPLARTGFDDMMRNLGARYGRPPTTFNFQGKTGEGEEFFSLVAVWGAIKLVRLSEAEYRAVAEGRAVGRGHLVDHRQDVRASARQRDPVYKIEGTAGFIAELRSMTDLRTDVVLRAVFQPAFTGEPAAAKPEAAPQYRILPLDPPLAYALAKIRAEEERLAAIERARRAEEERKAAEERARREEAERKAAELRRIEAERKAAEERKLAEERRIEEERKAAIERKAAEERRIEAERKAAEERKLAEERARREAAERTAEEERARRAEAERKAAEERRAMEEKARKEAAVRKAAEERARREEAERKAAEARRLAEERARREEAERKAAEERRVIEERFRRAEAEYKATAERARRAEAERKAAEERAQQAETERKAAEERAKRIEGERKAADERRAEERAEERRAEERRITEERARREEAERKAAAERAQREEAERKTAESTSREERRAAEERRVAEERARRPEGERADAGPRQAESVRKPPPASDRPKPEARRVAEEPSRRPAEPKIAGVAPGVGGPAPGREEWLRMAIAQSRNSTANWVLERLRDRISDDVLVQARAIFAVGARLALEVAFECNIDAGKRLRAHVRAFDARTNAAIPIPAEDGRTSVTRGSVTLDEDAPQTAFMFPERDERQASIVEIPVTDDDIRKNTPRAQVWLRHFRVAIKFRVAQAEASATIYPYSENLRRVLEACSP